MEPKFTLGGAVWINLVNTIIMQDGQRVDVLKEPDHIRQWLEENGFQGGEPLNDQSLSSVRHELALLREISADALFELLREGRLSDQTFSRLSKISRNLVVDVRLGLEDGRAELIHEGRTLADRVGYAVLSSLVETLDKYPPERIRKCEHEACIIHFVDTSKSGKRRWCSMDLCGNRQKAAGFYARQRERLGK
jgi:predicted RNA-binding Zn ribbon-like protein